MPKMKPILFNTEMVKAILDGRKTVTRRVAKHIHSSVYCQCEYCFDHEFIRDDFADGIYTGYVCRKCGYGVSSPYSRYPVGTSFIRPLCQPSDILYVRETWNTTDDCGLFPPWPSTGTHYMYLADAPDSPEAKEARWRPSIHMPKEAARIFLRVTDVRVERLQDVDEGQARKEGFLNDIDLINGTGKSAAKHFSELWDSTVKPDDKYGWNANPWVWVIEFERINREDI